MDLLNMKNVIFLITNIPFIYSFHLILKSFFEWDKSKRRLTVFLYILFYFINTANYIFINRPSLNLLGFILFFTIILSICYKGNVRNKCIIGGLIIGCGFLMEMASAYFVAMIFHDVLHTALSSNQETILIIIVSKFLIFTSGLYISSHEPEKYSGLEVPHFCMIVFLMLPFCSLFLIMCFFMEENSNLIIKNAMLTAGIVLIFIMNLGVFVLFQIVIFEYNKRNMYEKEISRSTVYKENDIIQRKNLMDMERYQHDTKKVLLRLKKQLQLNQLDQAMELLDSEIRRLYTNKQVINTGQPELNNLINHKLSYCGSTGISISTRIMLGNKEPYQDITDLCILVECLLDIAIDSCNCADTEKRIDFLMEIVKETYHIRIRFPFADEIIASKDYNKKIVEIQNIIKKYDGSLLEEQQLTALCLDVILL